MSVISEQAEHALMAYENVIRLLSDYQIARGNYRMKRIDVDEAGAAGERVSSEELTQLEELEEECDSVRVRLCEQIPIVRELMLQAISAMERADGHEIDVDLLGELRERIHELPACPPRSDFLDITVTSATMDALSDEIIISSSENDDADKEEGSQQVINSVREVIGSARRLMEMRAKMRALAEKKKQGKAQMFALRDRQQDTSALQQQQRDLFNEMSELKGELKRLQAEIKLLIESVLPRVNDEILERELLEILNNVDWEESFNISQPSRIPQVRSRLPQPAARSQKPPAQSRLPQPASRLQQPPVQLGIPRVHSRIPQPRPQPQQVAAKPSRLPQVQRARIPTAVNADIERHKSKIARAKSIRQSGSFVNLMRARELQQQPRVVPKSVIEERVKKHKTVLKLSESIGNVRKVGVRPINETPFNLTSADVRSQEVNKLQLKSLSLAQRKSLHKQNSIKKSDDLSRKLADAEAIQKRMIAKMTLEERRAYERECVDHLISSMINAFFKEFEPGLEQNLSHEVKMKVLENKLKLMFDNIRETLAQFRGASFTPDEPANHRFIQMILNHFNARKDFQGYRQTLSDFFKQMPYPSFRKPSQLTAPKYQRPVTAGGRTPVSRTLVRRPVTSTPSTATKSQIQSQVRTLQNASLQKSLTTTSTREKLDAFATSFCKLFIKNQKNRRNKFDVWAKIFRDNLNPILGDLDAFYKSMPYPEFKKFSRKQVQESLDRLLFFVYEKTRSFDITNVKCKSLIGNELMSIMERKHLGKLNKSMEVFLRGVRELIEPYVEELENESKQPSLGKSHLSSFLQRNRTRDTTEEESIDVPSFGDDESLTSKVPVRELQTMYRQIARGTFQQPEIVGTAKQVMAMDRVTANLRARVQRAAVKKRDQSLMRVRRDPEHTLENSLIENIAPSSLATFKRIMGTGSEYESIETTDEILKALDVVLEHCEDVDMKMCTVLSHGNRSRFILENPIGKAVSRLVNQIRTVLFRNDNRMMRQIDQLYKCFDRIDSQRLIMRLGETAFRAEECERMLDNPFAVAASEEDEATRAVLEFIKDLRYAERKFLAKILKGEIYGEIEAIEETFAPIAGGLSGFHDTPRIHQPVRVLRDMVEVPSNLLERDILYVACQLTRRAAQEEAEEIDEFATDHMDYVSKFVLSIARSFQEGKLSEHDALRIIRQIVFLLPCIPQHFVDTFVYHTDNEYFRAIHFENPHLNATVRNQLLFHSDRKVCGGDRLLFYLQQNILVSKVEAFMRIFDNDILALARTLNDAEKSRVRTHIAGGEIANNGSGVLSLPEGVTVGGLDEIYGGQQLNMLTGGVPQGDAAGVEIKGDAGKIDALLVKQSGEEDHLDNSKVAKVARKFELRPSALRRKNYFQSRGSELPQWFPGFYTVFCDSHLSRPVEHSSPFTILTHAWRSMAPMVTR